MPKAILEFDLSDLDDRKAHQRAIAADDMHNFIWFVAFNMRKQIIAEIEAEGKKLSTEKVLNKVFDKIWVALNDYNISPENLDT